VRLFVDLDDLQGNPPGPFEKIKQLISAHFDVAKKRPQETAVVNRICPENLN